MLSIGNYGYYEEINILFRDLPTKTIKSLEEISPFMDKSIFYVILNNKEYLKKEYEVLNKGLGNIKVLLLYKNIDKRTKLYKTAVKNERYTDIELSHKDKVKILSEYSKKDKTLCKNVLDYYGNNLDIARLELDKLKYIENIPIEDVLTETQESRIFSIADAILQKKEKESIELLNEFKEKGESPVALMTILIKEILMTLKVLNASKNASKQTNQDYTIASSLNIKVWQVKKYKKIMKTFSSYELVRLMLFYIKRKETHLQGKYQEFVLFDIWYQAVKDPCFFY